MDASYLMDREDYLREVERQREYRRVNEATALSAARREGRNEIILNMLEYGIPMDIIKQATGLTEKEIQALK